MNGTGNCATRKPALMAEMERVDKGITELGGLIAEIRNILDIADLPTIEGKPCPPPSSAHLNKVEVRAQDFGSLADRLQYLANRLSPVLDVVREI